MKVWVAIGGLVLLLVIIGTCSGDDEDETGSSVASPTATATPTRVAPTATPTVEEPAPKATLTAEESMQEFVFCDRLRANSLLTWGQAPGVIYSGDPRISGQLEPGDYVRFMMADPNADGEIRIKVYPHDSRAVGKTNDQVWIHWDGLLRFRSDRTMFTCED